MSWLRTKTPNYRGQPAAAPEPTRAEAVCGWMRRLTRTATPAYATPPEPDPAPKSEPEPSGSCDDRPQAQRRR